MKIAAATSRPNSACNGVTDNQEVPAPAAKATTTTKATMARLIRLHEALRSGRDASLDASIAADRRLPAAMTAASVDNSGIPRPFAFASARRWWRPTTTRPGWSGLYLGKLRSVRADLSGRNHFAERAGNSVAGHVEWLTDHQLRT